ncbi:50S ribosomal protein L3 N(5)-glutamine methyltransferase [Castellaniella denitrificans]|uniref:Ribosomal protein uL3 glutamine methyltransferase n=1 Tax=Castellaniella denitrificans TaxID=56119 RepID=A0ABT4M9Q9_9BURK|nr:50S ribosomal protein L3 N(5)-glutamine methyltransferase [Castellaniella denitrificans]MCZ4330851.1 50S ribosomal protein L3 N(5)-glutamine methyltransferase [Castellaniella denitrificans]
MSSPHTELLTLRDLLRWSISRFHAAGLVFGHGSDNAWDEAAYLLLHGLHLPPDTLDPFLDARLLERERQRCVDLIHERINTRKPAAYLTGEAWLQGERFLVDERVIVPRSPIAELLAEGLAPWIEDPDAVGQALDLCTGSGCLAILAAHAFGHATVDAVDVSTDALAVAQSNIELHGLRDRVQALRSDLLSQVPADRRYDLIVCNPPYVNEQSMKGLPPEYRHEPRLALAGGADGMDLVRRILADAPRFMAPEGLLVLEIGHERAHFEAAFPELEPVWLDTAATTDQILLLRRAQLAS